TAPTTPAEAVDLLFQTKANWWDRSWFFCDHVLAALQVEGLLFGLRRRGQLSVFNELGNRLEYIMLDAHVHDQDLNRMMSNGDDDQEFDNREIPESDLQVGDQV